MYVGKTLFAQLMQFVPWTSFSRVVARYSGDKGVRSFACTEQFRAMAFAQLTWRESLRDIEASLGANRARLYAMGFRSPVHRSTLADALELRDWRIWQGVASLLIKRARRAYSACDLGLDLHNTVYALDATTIDLCLSLFAWAPFRSTKSAIKLHTLLDLRGNIPAFIHISDGKLHEVGVLDWMPVEREAIYVMDRGYLDFSRLYAMGQAGAFFVTRAKQPMAWRRVYSSPVDRTTGVLCDQRIRLTTRRAQHDYPQLLRRVRYRDPAPQASGAPSRTLVFLTNNLTLPALTIAQLYKRRWQVELFFKWIKQHLRIKTFLGTSENAVKTQVWCAIATYVLITLVKHELKIAASPYTMLQILSVSLFEKISLSEALDAPKLQSNEGDEPKQLILLGF